MLMQDWLVRGSQERWFLHEQRSLEAVSRRCDVGGSALLNERGQRRKARVVVESGQHGNSNNNVSQMSCGDALLNTRYYKRRGWHATAANRHGGCVFCKLKMKKMVPMIRREMAKHGGRYWNKWVCHKRTNCSVGIRRKAAASSCDESECSVSVRHQFNHRVYFGWPFSPEVASLNMSKYESSRTPLGFNEMGDF